MKLFLIRHGESEANLHRYYAGQSNAPLTDVGRQQAAALQPVLKSYSFDKVYASDLLRAKQTCEYALPGTLYEPLSLLREYDIGSLTGLPFGSIPLQSDDDPACRPDYTDYGGENGKMVCARAKTFLDMLENQPCEYVAAFTHYGFINGIFRTILQTTYKNETIYTGNCSIHVVEYDGEKWKITALNYGVKV